MPKTFPDPIRVHLRGAHVRTVWMRSWTGENTKATRAKIRCSLTDLSGSGVFNISTTYGETKGLKEWRLTDESQAELIEWAATQGREIEPSRRKAKKARARKVPKADKKQSIMGWD